MNDSPVPKLRPVLTEPPLLALLRAGPKVTSPHSLESQKTVSQAVQPPARLEKQEREAAARQPKPRVIRFPAQCVEKVLSADQVIANALTAFRSGRNIPVHPADAASFDDEFEPETQVTRFALLLGIAARDYGLSPASVREYCEQLVAASIDNRHARAAFERFFGQDTDSSERVTWNHPHRGHARKKHANAAFRDRAVKSLAKRVEWHKQHGASLLGQFSKYAGLVTGSSASAEQLKKAA